MLSRLIIIGNGFDLAHGLHTKYSDFMEYLCSYEKEPEIIYKCALVAKGLFSLSFPRLVFSKTPALVHSSKQVGKRSAHPRPAWQ